MSISVIFSATNGGAALPDPLNHGNISNGANTAGQTVYVRHDGVNPITGCGLYIAIADALTYAGNFTATDDITEAILWGDAASSPNFGGFQVNFNATGGFPSPSWPTFTNKTTVDTFGKNVRTGVGDAVSNPMILPTATGASATGSIQAGASPNVRFRSRIAIPSSTTKIGTRQYKLKLLYNYSS